MKITIQYGINSSKVGGNHLYSILKSTYPKSHKYIKREILASVVCALYTTHNFTGLYPQGCSPPPHKPPNWFPWLRVQKTLILSQKTLVEKGGGRFKLDVTNPTFTVARSPDIFTPVKPFSSQKECLPVFYHKIFFSLSL